MVRDDGWRRSPPIASLTSRRLFSQQCAEDGQPRRARRLTPKDALSVLWRVVSEPLHQDGPMSARSHIAVSAPLIHQEAAPSARRVPDTLRLVRPSSTKAGLIAKCVLALGLSMPVPTLATARADADGWAGEGWYVSSDISAATTARSARPNILFDGPHVRESQCAARYEAFYAPIGQCRHFTEKPVTPE